MNAQKQHESQQQSFLYNRLHTVMAYAKTAAEQAGSVLGEITRADKVKQKHFQEDVRTQGTTKSSRSTFEEQLPKLAKRLIGKRLGRITGVVNKLVPESVAMAAGDTAFKQLANLAQVWSRIDADTSSATKPAVTLTEAQRAALADKVANEGRLLAAVGGGLTGLTGLFGLLADLLWLLLVCLKTVYQTAHIYGFSLQGADGARRALDILAQADLSKIGEKQAVMLGMGTLGEVFDDADLKALENLVDSNNTIAMVQKAFASITEQFGVDIHISWLDRFIPVAASLTSAAYSVYIINEVSAVAQAQFAPKLAITNRSDAQDNTDASI